MPLYCWILLNGPLYWATLIMPIKPYGYEHNDIPKKKNVSHRINYLSWRSPGESHKLSHIIAGVCSGVEWTHCLFPGGFSWSTSNTKSVLKRRGRQPLKRTEHWYHLFRVDQAPSASNVPNLTCFLPLEENSKQIDWWQSNWTYPEHVTNQVDSFLNFFHPS